MCIYTPESSNKEVSENKSWAREYGPCYSLLSLNIAAPSNPQSKHIKVMDEYRWSLWSNQYWSMNRQWPLLSDFIKIWKSEKDKENLADVFRDLQGPSSVSCSLNVRRHFAKCLWHDRQKQLNVKTSKRCLNPLSSLLKVKQWRWTQGWDSRTM